MSAWKTFACAAIAIALTTLRAFAHEGPPFPILSNHTSGPYVVAIWTDPDTTDDGSARGQFWVKLHTATGEALPRETQVTVAIRPSNGSGPERTAAAAAVRGDVSNQFAALVMDHEGRFAVRVTIGGPLGAASADAEVDATYDVRPPPSLILVYLVPFALAGLLWGRLLVKRYRSARTAAPLRRTQRHHTTGRRHRTRSDRRPDVARSGDSPDLPPIGAACFGVLRSAFDTLSRGAQDPRLTRCAGGRVGVRP